MSSRVCATGHIKYPVPLIERSKASCPGGRFSPSFIHQIIILTGLNKYTNVCSRPEDGLRCRQGVKAPFKLKTQTQTSSVWPMLSNACKCFVLFSVQGSFQGAVLHDTTYLYFLLLNETLEEGGDWRNGTLLFEKAKNRRFEGDTIHYP